MDAEREARRAARARWPIHKTTLEHERTEVLSGFTPSELVAMVHRLTLDAWAMSGRPLPDLPRDQWPGRIIRPQP